MAVARETRQQMIDGTIDLLASGGMQQTSFATVLERTGAPRGSIYHHFPEGKDQLVGAAVQEAGARARGAMAAWRGESALVVAERFLGLWRSLLVVREFRTGCAIVAVATSTESDRLREGTAEVFRGWRTELAELLALGGLPIASAPGVAALLIAACEGAVVICRAEQSLQPFDDVAGEVLARVAALIPA